MMLNEVTHGKTGIQQGVRVRSVKLLSEGSVSCIQAARHSGIGVNVGVALILGLFLAQIACAQDEVKEIAELSLRQSSVPVRDMKAWRRPTKIVVLIDSEARLQWFRAAIAGSKVQLLGAHNPSEFLSQVKGADAVEGICTPAVVEAGSELRWIQTQSVGVENCLAIPRVDSGSIILTNMQEIDAPNVAEHALALLLALSRQIPAFVTNQKERTWTTHLAREMFDLQDRTLLIVGLGSNGTAIAERAHAFGMHIIATRYSSASGPGFVDYVGAAGELPALIGRADVVVNTTPLTPQTTGLFDATMFAKMKRSAFFINVGRGKSVVTADLAKALGTGQIGGAALDVVDPEPLPPNDPLWLAPNLIITPHVANQSAKRMERFWLVMRENLRRYVVGDPLLFVVDPKRGY
jgi:phosphoglycerate dehydrogenase-like enzyme